MDRHKFLITSGATTLAAMLPLPTLALDKGHEPREVVAFDKGYVSYEDIQNSFISKIVYITKLDKNKLLNATFLAEDDNPYYNMWFNMPSFVPWRNTKYYVGFLLPTFKVKTIKELENHVVTSIETSTYFSADALVIDKRSRDYDEVINVDETIDTRLKSINPLFKLKYLLVNPNNVMSHKGQILTSEFVEKGVVYGFAQRSFVGIVGHDEANNVGIGILRGGIVKVIL